ncbi:MAG: NAD(P)H-dependent oxidoreductase subunit E, partial [Omnitrophica bacterium]|nr:NAD(P)H-dependent oxidoreductase subunit E [Candidatus Omnitrophota bacterium]
MAEALEVKKINSIVKKHKSTKSGLIGMLQDLQYEYSYLPKNALTHIAEKLNTPVSQVYSLATFYKAFSLKPRGKYLISLCRGTA